MDKVYIVTGTYYDAATRASAGHRGDILKVFMSKDDAEDFRRSMLDNHYPYDDTEDHWVDIEEHEIVRKGY